jgi:hypothetical protein
MENISMANPTMSGELMFPSNYVSAPDLKGKDFTVTIARVERETLKTTKGDEDKWVVTFKEAKKKLVLNKTNAKAIAKALGISEASDWPGHQITLYPTTCQAFGAVTDCIRVRERAPR